MPLALRILIGLLAGFLVGLATERFDAPWTRGVATFFEPVGTVFINAIRMTVIPLVVAKLVVGVAGGADDRAIGRLGVRTALLYLTLLLTAAAFATAVAFPLLRWFGPDPGMAASLRDASSVTGITTSQQAPSLSTWLTSLVPANAIRAAADGAMLPLIIFSLLFGVALSKVERDRRRALLSPLGALGDAMLILVHWILLAAPLGVFALTIPIAARLGLAAAGALVLYVALVALVCLGFAVLVLYPMATILGGVPLSRFARAMAPAQSIAFSSRSSLATLPVMIEQAKKALMLPEEVTGFVLPLAASMLKVGTVMAMIVAALFVATLYGVTLDLAQAATVALVTVIVMCGSTGVPSGALFVITPALMAGGIPVEGLGILLAVDTFPDMIRTTTNVTTDMAAAVVLSRSTSERSKETVEGVAAARFPEART